MKIKEEKGITLVALVITIVVLLILAGVSISLVLGQNGLITKAQEAKQSTISGSLEEKIKLSILSSYNNNGEIVVEKLKEELENNKLQYEGNEWPIKVSSKDEEYIITSQGQVINNNLIKYNKDGLKVCLDAQNNTNAGYSNNTAIWYDLSGNENNATLSNFEFNEKSGWNNGALIIKGNTGEKVESTELVKIPYSLKENESFSVEMVFEDNDDCRTTYLSADDGWNTFKFHDYIDDEGKYKGDFYIGGNIYSNHYNRFVPDDTNLLIEKRRKYYIAYTYDGNTNTAKLYINGIENSYTKEYEGNMDACNYFMINALESDGTKSGSAKYYQIRFYDRVLDEKDIKYNFDIDNDKYNIEK